MTFDEIKAAVRGLDDQGKKRVVMGSCCGRSGRKLSGTRPAYRVPPQRSVDSEAVRESEDEHMDAI